MSKVSWVGVFAGLWGRGGVSLWLFELDACLIAGNKTCDTIFVPPFGGLYDLSSLEQYDHG